MIECCYCHEEIGEHDGVPINIDFDLTHRKCEDPYKAKRDKEMAFIASASDDEFKGWMMGDEIE